MNTTLIIAGSFLFVTFSIIWADILALLGSFWIFCFPRFGSFYWRRHAAWHCRPFILGLGVFVLCFGKLRVQGSSCRSFGWSCLILFDLGRSWQILKKCCLQTSVQKGHSKSTTNLSKWRNDQSFCLFEQKWHQHRPKMGPIWLRGGGKGYQQINKHIKKRRKRKAPKWQHIYLLMLMCGYFLKNRRAQPLGVYRWKKGDANVL